MPCLVVIEGAWTRLQYAQLVARCRRRRQDCVAWYAVPRSVSRFHGVTTASTLALTAGADALCNPNRVVELAVETHCARCALEAPFASLGDGSRVCSTLVGARLCSSCAATGAAQYHSESEPDDDSSSATSFAVSGAPADDAAAESNGSDAEDDGATGLVGGTVQVQGADDEMFDADVHRIRMTDKSQTCCFCMNDVSHCRRMCIQWTGDEPSRVSRTPIVTWCIVVSVVRRLCPVIQPRSVRGFELEPAYASPMGLVFIVFCLWNKNAVQAT